VAKRKYRDVVRIEDAREGEGGRGGSGRWSASRKAEVVLRLLRGEEIDAVSREVRVNAATLAQWREEFIAAGRDGLKSRAAEPGDRTLLEVRAKVGELTMKNEILECALKKRGLDVPWTRS
jgi:hypothetical protein